MSLSYYLRFTIATAVHSSPKGYLYTMIAIQDKLISDEVVQAFFACELSICKGACCVDGDYGAPLEEEECKSLEDIIPAIKPYLPEASYEKILKDGGYVFYEDVQTFGTQLMPEGPCVFMNYDEHGIAICGIEKAWKEGAVNFRKPISCHLYPIRVKHNPDQGFTALNYDRWHICRPACANGLNNKIPLYKFLKEALIRKFGEAFYEELDAAAEELGKKELIS